MDILKRKDSVPNTDDISQTHKYLSRIVSTIGGIVAIVLGFWVAFTLSAKCVVAGLTLVLSGIIIVTLEAPVLYCMRISFLEKMIVFCDSKPYWLKTFLYFGLALPPILICPGITTIGASLFIFISSALYGSMALGKKAKREEMISKMGATQGNKPNLTLHTPA
ncbi:unnamed protein product [Gordionus sp. m RMFG-2023]|uniref:calcium channel flower-like n=1 Tax=Gordionus sp. m RMFG-2023 TaxID=3053472 RepID=UPI0030E033EC